MNKLTEIKKALSKVTTGPWEWVEEYRDSADMGTIVAKGDVVVCDFGNAEQYYPSEGSEPNDEDKKIIVNAPEYINYLISLLEEKDKALHGQHRYFERISVTFGEFECQRLAKEAMDKYTSSNNEGE